MWDGKVGALLQLALVWDRRWPLWKEKVKKQLREVDHNHLRFLLASPNDDVSHKRHLLRQLGIQSSSEHIRMICFPNMRDKTLQVVAGRGQEKDVEAHEVGLKRRLVPMVSIARCGDGNGRGLRRRGRDGAQHIDLGEESKMRVDRPTGLHP